jgi:hypothetical protein
MGDERLRELERRFVATGAAEDGAAWLLERVRAGELARTRLEVAALCGHPGALLLTGREPPPDFARDVKEDTTQRGDPMWWGVNDWARALLSVDRHAALRAGWIAASATLHHWTAVRPDVDEPRQALDTVAAWLARPSPEGVARAIELRSEAERRVVEGARGLPDPFPAIYAGLAPVYCAVLLLVLDLPDEDGRTGPGSSLRLLLNSVADAEGTPARVMPLVQRDLLTWAFDPR